MPEEGDHETATFAKVAQQGKLFGFRTSAYWRSVETLKDLTDVTRELPHHFPASWMSGGRVVVDEWSPLQAERGVGARRWAARPLTTKAWTCRRPDAARRGPTLVGRQLMRRGQGRLHRYAPGQLDAMGLELEAGVVFQSGLSGVRSGLHPRHRVGADD